MKKTILSISFLLIAGLVFSQQDPQFSQNMFNKLANNPGYAGSNEAICATVLHRSQWIGFGGAPRTLNLSVDAGLPAIHGGVGLNIVKDAIGPGDGLSMLGLQLTYAYRTDLGAGQLGAGFSLGMLQSGLDGSALKPSEPDPNVPQGEVNGSKMDFGLGFYYNTQDVYIGLSSAHLTAPKIEWSDGNQFQTARHYFLIAGYAHELSPMFTLNPSIYLKSDGVNSQLDINTNVLYNNRLWGGVSYRLDEGLIALLGMDITDDLKFGIAYDVVMSEIKNNSLEFMLGYCFQVSYDRPVKSYKNPRFL